MAKMPAPNPARLNVVARKVVPQALYGCQATPVAAAPLRRLRAAVATVVDSRAARSRWLDLALALAHPREVDPAAHIFFRR
eukprot:15475177-Alexandrium_andersonii.AAC.1